MAAGFESSLQIPNIGPGPILDGAITDCEIVEHGGVGPKNVIRTDQSWDVTVKWYLEGPLLAPPFLPFFNFTGQWQIRIFLESMGPGNEYALPAAGPSAVNVSNFTQDPNDPDRRNYSHFIHTNAGVVDEGTYKVVLAITYESAPGTPGPIAGFHEAGMLQIYQP